jgi:hypothetical protein
MNESISNQTTLLLDSQTCILVAVFYRSLAGARSPRFEVSTSTHRFAFLFFIFFQLHLTATTTQRGDANELSNSCRGEESALMSLDVARERVGDRVRERERE